MSLSIKLGNFLYKNAFGLYKKVYWSYKKKQDAFEISLLREHIQAGNTVLDIGANIGFYAGMLSSMTGKNGEVHCFEPDPQNFSHLQKECADLKNVFLNNKAVGPQNGTLTFYTSDELNVDHRTYQPESYASKFEVQCVSIDSYVSGKKVDFIKMDIQGFEIPAIKGMKNTLEKNPHVKLLSEFWPYGLKQAGTSASELYNMLIKMGFTCYLLEKKALSLLDDGKVLSLQKLENDKRYYFNIFARRASV